MTVGARIVASTGADIEDAVRSGAFRHDLYHRLRVLPLLLPPLREHLEDVAPLARYFLKRVAGAAGRSAPALSREVTDALGGYHWPGNIRQLRHAIEHAYLVAYGGAIALEHLPREILDQALPEKRKRYGLE